MKINRFKITGDIVWIFLSQGKKTCVDLRDWSFVRKIRWYALKAPRTFYARATCGTYLHQLITGSEQADHKDHDGLNNLRSNLRPASCSQNHANNRKRLSKTTSKFKGVYLDKDCGKWRAEITCEGVRHRLGRFKAEVLAAKAYDSAARSLFKRFSYLNFP